MTGQVHQDVDAVGANLPGQGFGVETGGVAPALTASGRRVSE